MNSLDYEKIYRFTNVPGLYVDMAGNFQHDDKPVKKVCNNGSLAVQVGSRKFGIKKLRKTAFKDFKPKNICPF